MRGRWRLFLVVLACLNLVVACAYIAVGRGWVQRHYSQTRTTHPFQHHIVIEGDDFVRVSDAQFETLLFWELILVLTAALLRYAARGRGRDRLREAALLLATLLLSITAGETGLRVYQSWTSKLPILLPLVVYYDPVLGWKGKKVFGDLRSEKPRVLVVGDSFTDGLGAVAEEGMYYARLKTAQDVELFVYGGGGYGTLQEFIVLDRYLDEVHPGLVILQVTWNDFGNNSFPIESASYNNNNLMVRPFLEGAEIHYRFPKFLGGARLFLTSSSRLAYEGFLGIDRVEYKLMHWRWLSCIECRIAAGQERETFRASVRTTGAILDRFRDRTRGRALLVAFTVDLAEPYLSAFRRQFGRRGIPFLEGPARAVAAAEQRGAHLRLPGGGHLNEEGNRILGEGLVRDLVREGVLPLGADRPPERAVPGG